VGEDAPRDYHYTRDGHGIIDAVCKMFERGTFSLGEGDALVPVQEAYQAYKRFRDESLRAAPGGVAADIADPIYQADYNREHRAEPSPSPAPAGEMLDDIISRTTPATEPFPGASDPYGLMRGTITSTQPAATEQEIAEGMNADALHKKMAAREDLTWGEVYTITLEQARSVIGALQNTIYDLRTSQSAQAPGGMVDREALAKVVANPASKSGHLQPLKVDYVIADAILSSGIIAPIPTREQIKDAFAKANKTWLADNTSMMTSTDYYVDAIEALLQPGRV